MCLAFNEKNQIILHGCEKCRFRKHGNRRRTGLDEPSTLEVVGGRQEVLEVVDLRWMPKSVNSSEVEHVHW